MSMHVSGSNGKGSQKSVFVPNHNNAVSILANTTANFRDRKGADFRDGKMFFLGLLATLAGITIPSNHPAIVSVAIDGITAFYLSDNPQVEKPLHDIGYQHMLHEAVDNDTLLVGKALDVFDDLNMSDTGKTIENQKLRQFVFTGALQAVIEHKISGDIVRLSKEVAANATRLNMADSDIVVEALEHLDPDTGRMPQQAAAHQSHGKRAAAEA